MQDPKLPALLEIRHTIGRLKYEELRAQRWPWLRVWAECQLYRDFCENHNGEYPGKLCNIEREAILAALKLCSGYQKGAARRLGISERALGYQMRKHGISRARDGNGGNGRA